MKILNFFDKKIRKFTLLKKMEKYRAEILTYKLDLGFPLKILWALKMNSSSRLYIKQIRRYRTFLWNKIRKITISSIWNGKYGSPVNIAVND